MTANGPDTVTARFDHERLLQRPLPTVRQRYTWRDTVLYALGVGAAQGPHAWDEHHLRFVYEERLQALPTMCAMLGDPGFWMREPDTGLDWQRLVHAEESVQWFKPLPPEGEVVGHNRVVRVEDRGPSRGAMFVVERKLRDADTSECWVRSQTTVMARGNGGFSPPGMPLVAAGAPAESVAASVPAREPDRSVMRPTATHQPLLYRLSADLNPLHCDPAVARAAGFERPIMHGMATFGLLGMLLLTEFGNGEAGRLTALRTRFTAPLYPGETLRCDFWEERDTIQFRATAVERNAVILDRGLARIDTRDLHQGA